MKPVIVTFNVFGGCQGIIRETMSVHISDTEIKAYANVGAVLLKNLLSPEEVADLSAGVKMEHKLFQLIWPAN